MFGSRLRHLREAAGLTQEELAPKAGLSARAISVLERGERKRPYPHTLRSIAEALALGEEERTTLFAALPERGAAAIPAVPAAVWGVACPRGQPPRWWEGRGKVAGLFPEGAAFVALAPVGDAALVLPTAWPDLWD